MARAKAGPKSQGKPAQRRRRRREAPEKAGKLKPANPFDLIRLLARSQHDPRKAVAELVQNSLDADARHVQITRHRTRGTKLLSIRDDGQGVLPELSRREALTYIATHIGHSRKRDLSVEDRYRLFLQGKYGIGLLGFWCVGHGMEIRTKVGDEPALVLRLAEDSPRYEIFKDRRELELSGVWTEVVVRDLHDTASRQLTGRRLADYLAEELRGQLLEREVDLRVVDRLARGRADREFPVVPPRFKGIPIEQPTRLRVPGYRPARVQLHYLPDDDDPCRVALFSGGTLVVEDLSQLPGLDHSPWTAGKLVGMVDFAALDAAPGTRRGVVPNAAARAFASAMPRLERQLVAILASFEQERHREREASLAKQLRRIFSDFGRRMPLLTAQSSAGGSAVATERKTDAAPSNQSELFLPGPLHSLEILPRDPLAEVHQAHELTAVARDLSGRRLSEGIELEWSLGSGSSLALIRPGLGRCSARFEARASAGLVEVLLRGVGVDGGRAEASTTVEICDDLPALRADLVVPDPSPVRAPDEPWRSRMTGGRWEYNAAHPDYLAVADDDRRRLRYIAALLAKEVVLRGHPRAEIEGILERMLQVIAWVERRMPK